ncbi:hypothetical protein COOONC_08407 [Cooperia oncophora]
MNAFCYSGKTWRENDISRRDEANPPSLLSNVQYVQGFGGSLLDGAEGYWWTQFTAAIEFVKTLL